MNSAALATYRIPNAVPRIGAISCIAAGILMIAGFGLHPAEEDPTAGTDPLWVPAHALLWAAFTLALPGWIGLYLAQASEAGRLGVIAFLLIIVGTSLASWIYSSDVTFVPVIAAESPHLFKKIYDGTSIVLGMVSVFSWVFGNVLFGISVVRARVFSRWSGILLAVGTAFIPIGYIAGLSVHMLAVAASVAAIGQIWLGLKLLRMTATNV